LNLIASGSFLPLISRGLAKGDPFFGQLDQPNLDALIDASKRELTFDVAISRRKSGQNLDPLVDTPNRKYPKLAGGNCLDNVTSQHEMPDIGGWNQDSLIAGQSTTPAEIEITLDLFVDTPDRLNFAVLIDRSGNGE
jgi:hypothetical protein